MSRIEFAIVGARCPTVNDVYAEHWRKRAKAVSTWRLLGKAKCRTAIDAMGGHALQPPLVVFATPLYAKGPVTDVGGVLPAVKAVIDGAIDAGLIADDSPSYVSRLILEAPQVGGVDGLAIVLAEALGDACVACDLPLTEAGLVFPTGRRLCAACLRTVEPYRPVAAS